MNEIFYGLGWVIKTIELFVVIFWVHQFSKLRWKLFFGIKKDLVSVEKHELYSCFLTAFAMLIFHLIASEVDQFILTLNMEQLEKIKLFYTSGVIVQFSFAMTLMCLHLIRDCTFSPTARICMYTTLVYMMLQGMELISRAYYDYHDLGLIYQVGVWVCNFIAVGALCTYPIRSIKEHFKQRRAAAE
ncbi:hypothetical protein HG263_15630 [Pseudoalteromonas sp. JBTF-M23]|uniref:Uncharacterized protein n=1 Tax=Pseudoalteromonas caenipelagi TaxID=2726988 RepID=A0A849VHL6_9GAMM|nr:hypothetical protein [Pseudoalteromonas caenipelagi]NOU51963.1 hypothetical protein [Pseudoalteromonas caenipelagi]